MNKLNKLKHIENINKRLLSEEQERFEYNDDDGLDYALLREIDGSDEYNKFRQHYTKEIRSFLTDNNGRFVMSHQLSLNIITDVTEMIKKLGYEIRK